MPVRPGHSTQSSCGHVLPDSRKRIWDTLTDRVRKVHAQDLHSVGMSNEPEDHGDCQRFQRPLADGDTPLLLRFKSHFIVPRVR